MSHDAKRSYDERHLCPGLMARNTEAYPNAETYDGSAYYEGCVHAELNTHTYSQSRLETRERLRNASDIINHTIPCETLMNNVSTNNPISMMSSSLCRMADNKNYTYIRHTII